MKNTTLAFCLVIICLIAPHIVFAQSIDETRKLPILFIDDVTGWSTDSQWFTFVDYLSLDLEAGEDITPTLRSPSWIAYQPLTNRYVAGQTWWLQPTLSDSEKSLYNTNDTIRSSPDGNLILFSVLDEERGYYLYHLANRETQQIINLDIWVTEVNFGRFYPVFWGDYGDRLAVTNIPSPYEALMAYWYIEIPDRDNFNTLNIIRFPDGIESHDFLNDDYFVDRLFDMDGDGERLLLNTRDLAVDADKHLFVVWYPLNPEETYVIDNINAGNIATVAFSPTTDDHIIILYKNGDVILHDIMTTRQTSLTNIGDSLYATSFSPNGRWLAYGQNSGLYMLDIEQLLLQDVTTESN